MGITVSTANGRHPSAARRRARRADVPLWQVAVAGAGAAALGSVAASLYAMAIRTAGVPMRAASLGATSAKPLTTASFVTGVIVCTFWGTVLAAATLRLATNPTRSFVRSSIALTVLSLVVPVGAAHTPGSTKAAVIGAHVLVAGVVIPVLTRRLRASTVSSH